MSSQQEWTVIKRDGHNEPIRFDKISERLRKISEGLNVNYIKISKDVISQGIASGVTTTQLDIYAAQQAAYSADEHPDYSILAARITGSNLRKNVPHSFLNTMEAICDRVRPDLMEFIRANADALNSAIDYSRNSRFSYLAYQMLESKYMVQGLASAEHIRPEGVPVDEPIVYAYDGTPMIMRNGIGIRFASKKKFTPVDNPQHMYMRVAIAARAPNLEEVLKVYDSLSSQMYTHATPTLFNSCMSRGQLLSCFLLCTEDSIEGIMKNAKDASIISKNSGGIGIHQTNIRGAGAYIYGTSGITNGLIKQLDIYDKLAATWNQGGEKRPGSFAIYLEPWHSDILGILRRFKPHESDTLKQKLFLALWIPDLFFKKFFAQEDWCLFNDQTAPGLADVYDGMEVCTKCEYCYNCNYSRVMLGKFAGYEGAPAIPNAKQATCSHTFARVDAFTRLYHKYAGEGRAITVVPAKEIMSSTILALQQSGVPYLLSKDASNKLSNQQNLGTIRSSNLCTEIIEWSGSIGPAGVDAHGYITAAPKSYACCVLSSINLPRFFRGKMQFLPLERPATDTRTIQDIFDFPGLYKVVREITRSLDNLIDTNKYPVFECEDNSKKYRPIGIGVQGLADLLFMAQLPFDCELSKFLDVAIAETIYFAFLSESALLARERGAALHWDTSPLGRGLFHFELYDKPIPVIISGMYDWESLRAEITSTGFRNYLGVAYMPTVSTSQLLGNNESFEPFMDVFYKKDTSSGSFFMINEIFQRHMLELNLWTKEFRERLITANGNLAVMNLPAHIYNIYKPIWDISQRVIVSRAAARAPFIDQSQSLNAHMKNGGSDYILSRATFAWEQGLPTISYYTRVKPTPTVLKNITQSPDKTSMTEDVSGPVCRMEEGCIMCSS